MKKLLVIGGASYDTLHLADRTVNSAGGAGMYTAMAALRCGVGASLFSPRPEPCPEYLRPVAERLTAWLGPSISPEALPHFEIDNRAGKTEYLAKEFKAELSLSPTMLPPDLGAYDLVHVVPLGDARLQLSFVEACRQRGAKQLSAGTYIHIVQDQPEIVRSVIRETDFFFMNHHEAKAFFGSIEAARTWSGKVIFITFGQEGAGVVQGDTLTFIPAQPAVELDPTGAGDSFCGATLAYLMQNEHPIMAARHATPLAAETISQVGPTALLTTDPAPRSPLDERVTINARRLQRVAGLLSTLEEAAAFPFVGPVLPPEGHPKTLDYFFAATLQQFGFWSTAEGRYERPLIAPLGGASLKGSDYLWEAYRRQVDIDPEFCSPERQASLSREELLGVFRADDGSNPMPALELHLQQARAYGEDMLSLKLRPNDVLQEALTSDQPLATFLGILDQIGGYKEDPLRKKSSLLALILDQRPERFFPLTAEQSVAPVIDYHLMRTSLRLGLLDIQDERLERKLHRRQYLSQDEEWAVRYGTYQAIEQIIASSGRRSGAVDYFFFQMRKRCPEMTEPECGACPAEPACAQRKELFQPVIRTPFY